MDVPEVSDRALPWVLFFGTLAGSLAGALLAIGYVKVIDWLSRTNHRRRPK